MKNSAILLTVGTLLAVGAATWEWSSGRAGLGEQPTATRGKISPAALPVQRSVPRVFEPIAVDGLQLRPEDVEFARGLCAPSLPPSISLLAHELRLWGLEQSFDDYPQSRFSDSRCILNALTDARLAAEVTGYHGRSAYLKRSPYGLHVASFGRDRLAEGLGEPHFGHLAASFGAAGVTLEQQMYTSAGEQFTVRDTITDICFRYTPVDEPEFLASAMAHYLDSPYQCVLPQLDVEFLVWRIS